MVSPASRPRGPDRRSSRRSQVQAALALGEADLAHAVAEAGELALQRCSRRVLRGVLDVREEARQRVHRVPARDCRIEGLGSMKTSRSSPAGYSARSMAKVGRPGNHASKNCTGKSTRSRRRRTGWAAACRAPTPGRAAAPTAGAGSSGSGGHPPGRAGPRSASSEARVGPRIGVEHGLHDGRGKALAHLLDVEAVGAEAVGHPDRPGETEVGASS